LIQQQTIHDLKQEILILKMKLETAEENLNLMQLNMPKYFDRNLKPMIDQMIPLFEKMAKKTSE
ncbi:MAG: hypothetical protein KKB31_05865, partial [Nanoarchaeota archaeon]|nr:hypothetical protein [Nanoarchaeota archaeon]